MKKNAVARLLGGLAITSIAAMTLAGCAGDVEEEPNDPETSQSAGADGGDSGDGADGGDAAPSDGLTILTGRDAGEVEWVVAEFEKAFPEYEGKVETVIAGAQDNLDRMRAEASNPQAGVLWGGTQQQFEQAAEEGLLTPYTSKHDAAIPENYKSTDGTWVSEMLLPEVIIYNSDVLTPETAPQDWDELADPKWKDQIVIRDVMPSGTMRTIYSAMIYNSFKDTGTPDEGYELLKKVDANTVSYAATPDDMYTQIDQQVGTVTVWNMQDAFIQPNINNRPWGYVMPESGAPVLLDGVGIIKNEAQEEAAKAFMDFLLDPEMQAHLAEEYYQIPAVEIPDDQKPEWLASFEINEMDIDWAVFAENQDEWMTYWADNIKNKG